MELLICICVELYICEVVYMCGAVELCMCLVGDV